MKRTGVFLATASATVAVSALAAPAPALAAEAATPVAQARLAADLPTAPNLVANQAAADRDFVRWLSVHDPREAVRSVAQATLNGSGGATAITAFLTSGYASAADQAAQARVRQLDHANRMATTHPAPAYPWVNAAARRAANGTDAELAEFSGTGYAAALEKDDAKVPYDDGAAQVTQDDRDFVERLAFIDPGAAVRERAADVATDGDVAEFLRHGWVSAGGIDSDTFRAQYVADEWAKWREARQLTVSAVAVDQAAREGAASPVAAVQAWEAVRTRFVRQPAGWAERERFARERADSWTRTLVTAGESASPLWASLAGKGPAVRSQWVSEVAGAAEQTGWWNSLIQYAQAAVSMWTDPAVRTTTNWVPALSGTQPGRRARQAV